MAERKHQHGNWVWMVLGNHHWAKVRAGVEHLRKKKKHITSHYQEATVKSNTQSLKKPTNLLRHPCSTSFSVSSQGNEEKKALSWTANLSPRPVSSQQGRMAGFTALPSSGESSFNQALPHSTASSLEPTESFSFLAGCDQIQPLSLHFWRAAKQHLHLQSWRTLTCSHELIYFLRTAFRALHAVVFLQQLIDLRQVDPRVRGHAIGRNFPKQNTKGCSG